MQKITGLLMSALLLLPASAVAAGKKSTESRAMSLTSQFEKKLNDLSHVSRQRASSWRITPGDWSVESDALVLANTGDHPTDVWVTQRDNQGNILDAARIAAELLPDGRVGYVLGGPEGSPFVPEKDTWFHIAGTQLMTLVSYRGSAAGKGNILVSRTRARPLSKAASNRDQVGVWSINGGTVYDTMEMQGYNEASDRLWQAEFYKRVSSGRLAELFGPDLVNQDALVRSSGYSDQELDDYFAALSPESQEAVQGYVDGFNRRIAEVNATPSLIPFEFLGLGIFQVESWTVRDLMRWVSQLQRNFSSLGNLGLSQAENALILLDLTGQYGLVDGINIFQDMRWLNDPQAPTMIPADAAAKAAVAAKTKPVINAKDVASAPDIRGWVEGMRSRLDQSREMLDELGANVKGGSYAWVVSGSKTASGNPIIYSGPQMGFESPAIVMEGSIVSDEANLHISGMTVIGVPGILIGRTPHHAWSMQVGHTNTWDWYLENEEDVFLHHVETIKVNGGEDVVIPVYRSSRGPVFEQAGFLLSWKYASWGKEWNIAEGSLTLARAQSMDEFHQGVANLGVTQHYCYADRDGNIAYWMSGRNPVRPLGEYRLPQGFLAPPLEWDADVVHEPVNDRNTSQGFYAGWNNKASVDYDDTSANYFYGRYHRAEVVQKWLRENDNVTFEDLKALAVNISATQAFGTGSGSGGGSTWPWLKDAFMASANRQDADTANLVNALFADYDEHRVAGGPDAWVNGTDISDAWVLLDAWSDRVLEKTFDDDFGSAGNNTFRLQVLIPLLHPDSSLRRNTFRHWPRNLQNPSAPQTLEAIIDLSLMEVLGELGDQPWGIDGRGTLEYPHPLLGTFFEGTPWGARSTYAHCVEYDEKGPVRIESVFPVGQDGTLILGQGGQPTPAKPTCYFGMKDLYDNFILRPFPLFDRDE
ncbi:MAG: penicillin acylase family protein [Acidobacteriota bacterium]|nr:penicillin acylase family protein [Acidobacteriota bacterium]